MNTRNQDGAEIIFPVCLWPGPQAGSWHATYTEAGTSASAEFASALGLLRWLEGLEHTPAPPHKGLR